jgi:hypothetical protein
MIQYIIAGAIGYVVAKIFEEDESPKYADGGSVLLAPNGKPSNLTPEQYKLVRTKAFKDWFGDWENDRENSGKVSGITKEPVVFYHSTKSNFLSKKGENIFKNPPFFFSFKKDVSDYIVRIQHQNKKGRVYTKPFFLKYHNTFDLRHVKILKDKELTRLIKKHTFYKTESDIRLFELKLSLSKFSGNTWYLTENEDFQDYIKNKGYDSFVVYEDGDKNIAVFNPNQIKLADGTNTTFDGSNPDIRFDSGGEITTYTEFYNNLKIEDGSKYIGQKFTDVFPFIAKRKTPNDYRIILKQYHGILKRIEQDNYSTKAMKQTDLNKLERMKPNLDKQKYLARFYLDSKGVIMKFIK